MSALQISQFVATLCCVVFAGAAIYINLVEHPARMSCSTQIAASVWAPSYKRATLMQAPLAIVSFLGGIVSWLLGGGSGWLVGAIIILAVVPFTLIVIRPTNNQLLAQGRDLASLETRALLVRWGMLHGVRSALSLLASAIFLWLLVRA
jgi:uncharacterized membrane protein